MRRVRASVVNLFYLAVILVAAFKSLVFAATIYAENNINQVERWVSQAVGTQVHIDQISSSWSGLLPKIWLKNLSLGDAERLQLGDVRVNINIPSLPWWKTNPPLDIKLQGTHIHILREASGETRIVGLAERQLTPATTPALPALPAHVHIQNASILWEDKKHGAAEWQLEHMDVHLASREKQAQLVVNSPQHDLLIRSDLQGDILKNDWSADTYLLTAGLQASSFIGPYLPEQYTLDKLDLGLESWSQWRNGRHVATQAKLQMHQLELRNTERQRLTMNSASASIQFRRDPNHWQLQFSDFNIESTKGQWPNTNILLDLATTESGQQHLRIGVSLIPLQVLNRLSVIFRPAGNINQLLTQLSPTGELTNVRAHLLAGARPEISLQQLSADFLNTSIRAWKKIPAASNFSGHINVSSGQVQLDLNTQDASLIFPQLFRTPLPLSVVQGRLDWQPTAAGGWLLGSNKLIVENPDLKTISRLAIQARPDEPLFMDLQTDFHDGIGANAGTYYPVGIMDPKLVAWLDSAIVSGKVPRGSFLLRGPLLGFPYHNTHAGHFEVLFDAQDLLLNYQQGWPPLNDSNASIRFYNNELQVSASSAKILDSRVLQTSARIPSLKPGSAIHIQGAASGPLSDALRLLRETPLKEKFASAVTGMTASGQADTKLNLTIPLSTSANYAFEGQLSMQDTALQLTEHQLNLTNINGQLDLDLNGIRADNIRFNALGGELQMKMNQSAHASTLIELSGTLAIAEVKKQYSYLKPLHASGSAHANIQLDLPNNNKNAQSSASVRIKTDLRGISMDMPPPLYKSSDSLRPMTLSLALNTPQSDIRIKYADLASLQFAQNQADEYRITGSIETLPLHKWLDWFAQAEMDGQSDGFKLNLLDLNINHLSLGPFTTSNLQLTINQLQGRWLGELESNRLQGRFTVPDDLSTQPLVVELDKLTMHLAEESAQEQPDPLPTDNLNPLDFPAINFSCAELMMDDAQLGEVKIQTHKTREGMILETASINGRHVESQFTGSWLTDSNGTLTQLKGNLKSRNMGRLLKKIYGATPLADSKTTVDLDLNWKGAPFQYHPANAQGSIDLDVGKGRVLDLDPGAARMLGLMNIRSLNRRLRLDFSDLYKEGLSFDSIGGSFNLDEGHIYSNDLTIKSPSALIHISGNSDLIREQHDLLVTVSPKLDATLPVAGAIVGGPAAGLAVLLAQQAMSKPLSKLQRIKYKVQGPWDNSTVTHIKRKQEQGDTEGILDL